MSNRFDNPIGNRENFQRLYIPQPLGAITQLAQQRQKQFGDAMDDIGHTRGLIPFKADPVNYSYRDKLQKEWQGQVDNIATRASKEGWTPSLQTDWLRTKNSIIAHPERLRIEEQARDYEAYQKDRAKQQADRTYIPELDDYSKLRANDSAYTPWQFKGLESLQDYHKTAKDTMGNIASWGFDSDTVNIDPKTGNVIGIKSGKEEVADKRVRQLADEKAYQFFQTPAGAQYAARLARNNPNITNEDIHTSLSNYLYDANAEQIFAKTKLGNSFQYAPKYVNDKINDDSISTRQSEGINRNIEIPEVEKNIQFNKDGSLKTPLNTGEYITRPGKDEFGINDPNRQSWSTGDLKPNEKAKKDQLDYLNTIKTQHPELKGLKDKEVIEAFQKARKSISNESVPLNTMSNKSATDIGNALSRNLIGRTAYLYDGQGTTEPTTLDIALKKAGVSLEDLRNTLQGQKDESGNIKGGGVSGFLQSGETPGGYFVELPNGRRLVIEGDVENNDAFRTSHMLNKARMTMRKQNIKIDDNNTFEYIPHISKDGRYNEVFKLNGKDIQLTDLMRAEIEHSTHSGYLGSRTNHTKKDDVE